MKATDATAVISGFIGELNVYPNPASDKIRISFHANSNENVKYRLIRMDGSVALNGIWQLDEAHNEFVLEIESLVNGLYLLEIRNKDFRTANRVMIY